MSIRAAFSEFFKPKCCLSNIPTDWGLYSAEYLTSMLSLLNISFQRLEVNDPPLSDVTKEGRPHMEAQ